MSVCSHFPNLLYINEKLPPSLLSGAELGELPNAFQGQLNLQIQPPRKGGPSLYIIGLLMPSLLFYQPIRANVPHSPAPVFSREKALTVETRKFVIFLFSVCFLMLTAETIFENPFKKLDRNRFDHKSF